MILLLASVIDLQACYPSIQTETFFESCGIGDLIATCFGGRNRLVACEFTKAWKEGHSASLADLEKQLLQGTLIQRFR